jgi:hypothetical protein
MLVAEWADWALIGLAVVERATIEVESSLVVREVAVVASARGLLVNELASVIKSSSWLLRPVASLLNFPDRAHNLALYRRPPQVTVVMEETLLF